MVPSMSNSTAWSGASAARVVLLVPKNENIKAKAKAKANDITLKEMKENIAIRAS